MRGCSLVAIERLSTLTSTGRGNGVPGRWRLLKYQCLRGHALAHVLAVPLAKKLNFSGDPDLVEKYPMAFLARVYATFHETREEEDLEEKPIEQPARPVRRPVGAAR